MSRIPRLCLAAALGALVAGGAGCRTRTLEHEATGLVLETGGTTGTVTISHDPIPGFMDAMVMPFTAADAAELRDVRPGDRVSFRITVHSGATRIDRVRILSAGSGSPIDAAAAPSVAIGSEVPDFTLLDQDGRRTTLSAFRGRVVAVSFIYTRCPLPDYCPRVMTNFAALRDRFRDRLTTDLVLLTLTFDPRHDTPEKLRAFGEQYGANVPGWRLLTGAEPDVAKACASFGVQYYPDEGMITHTLQSAIVDRNGRLVAAAEGRGYSTKQLGDLVEAHLSR